MIIKSLSNLIKLYEDNIDFQENFINTFLDKATKVDKLNTLASILSSYNYDSHLDRHIKTSGFGNTEGYAVIHKVLNQIRTEFCYITPGRKLDIGIGKIKNPRSEILNILWNFYNHEIKIFDINYLDIFEIYQLNYQSKEELEEKLKPYSFPYIRDCRMSKKIMPI